MKRINGIWGQLTSFDNLLHAYRQARRGKRSRPGVAEFGFTFEHELFALQRELRDGSYQPGRYRLFTIYERKPRVIAAAPFRDRVVHHAVMQVIEPPLDRTFISDSYACRKGKGVHAAVDRYQSWAQTYRYVLKIDVQQYFPSIDHDLLKEKLRRRIKDARVLNVLDRIIESSPQSMAEPHYFPGDDLLTPLDRRTGIPIGNLTSQFFANLYLDDFDHYLKQALKIRPYLRYVDDMVVLDYDKVRLAETRAAVRERLATDRLRLHPHKAHVSPVADGLNLLGYVVYPARRRLRSDNGHRFSRKFRNMAEAYRLGRLEWPTVVASVQSWIGHAQHADAEGLRRAIFSQAVFRRGAGQETASA
ncbi:MAG: reverse transcriptase/maturase family protein [Nitrospira sp.]|nr:reverse transcriptase/maturase family protein [Nitrospira sp.]MDH4242342.1 reverse transcriptase/maturase family protein [Nitrospira sp.]MDH4358046.1 reverse transcriptase/maturase family protein [Nitrospira sp.]MDH5318232.1 reverse transcriptase/maturase family protein [Nitrospira sp.]